METIEEIQAEGRKLHDELWKLRDRLRQLKGAVEPHLPDDVLAEAMMHHMRPYSLAWEVHYNLTKVLEHFDHLMDYLLGAFQDTEEDCVVQWLGYCKEVTDEHLPRSLWALVGYCVIELQGKYLDDLPLLDQLNAPQDPKALRALVNLLYDRLFDVVGGGDSSQG